MYSNRIQFFSGLGQTPFDRTNSRSFPEMNTRSRTAGYALLAFVLFMLYGLASVWIRVF
jgi:hypothetical protein